MNLSKRVRYALLGFLIMLNITFRYPRVSHEYGVDTLGMHSLANTITKYGCAKWVINPASYFGLTPLSYPNGVLYLLSGISQCTGMNVEHVMLMISMFCGVFGALAAYIMAKEIRNDDLFAFIVAFSFSLSPVFLSFTLWSSGGRQLFMTLIPLLIWSVLRSRSEIGVRWGYVALSVVLLITLATIHRLILLLPFVLTAYFSSVLIYERGKSMLLSKRVIKIIPLICIIFFTILLLPQLFGGGGYGEYQVWKEYRSGYYFKGSEPLMIFLNIVIDYGSKFGILTIFGMIGLISIIYRPKRVAKDVILVSKAKRSFNDIFLVCTVLIFLPLSSFGPYIIHIIFPFVCLLIGLGVLWLVNVWESIRRIRLKTVMKKIAFPTVVVFLLLSIAFSNFMINHWINMPGSPTTTWMTEKEYGSGLFVKEYLHENDTFIANDYTAGARISGISEVRFFTSVEPQVLVYGWVDKEQLKLERIDISNLFKGETLYKYTQAEQRVWDDFWKMYRYDIESTVETRYRYGVNYAVESRTQTQEGGFLLSTHEQRYKIYDNGDNSIWYLGL